MRTTFLTLIALLSLLALPATTGAQEKAQKPDVVDTGKGLTFKKPAGWVVAPKKKGTAAALYAAGDKQSQIEFRFAEIAGEKAERYFHSFHGSLASAGLRKAEEGKAKKYGKLSGTLTVYSSSGEDPMKLYVYQFTHGGAAWLVVGMFNGEQAENYLKDYEKLLGLVVVE